MFDLIATGDRPRTTRGIVPLLTSWTIHAIVIGAVVVLPLFYATDRLPDAPGEVLAFVAPAAPAPPPPPPPPAAAPAAQKPVAREPRRVPRAVPTPTQPVPIAAPIEQVEPFDVPFDDEGVVGGVEGGVPGGVIGGIVGGLPDVPRPPAPPPPAQPRAPIRTGGELKPPALITRVPPVYPPIAVSAKIEGVVILEATVGRDGRVEAVRVLRSVGLLDQAAKDAVMQWRYAPLLLNGKPERFILTVTLTFSLT
jgi:protein TonB